MRQPIKFLPYFKSTAWGGRRISVFKNLSVNCSDIGESWELSAISGCESIVANGDDSGMTLPDLCIKYRERLLGENVYQRFGTEFPLLVKFIDAKTDTSMQVNISMQGDRDKETIGYAYYPEGDAAAHEGEESGTTALAQCEYFKVNKEDIEGSRTLSNAEDSFMGIVCIDGDGKLKVDGVSTSVRQGETLLLPAHVDEFDVEGVLSLLTVVIPALG